MKTETNSNDEEEMPNVLTGRDLGDEKDVVPTEKTEEVLDDEDLEDDEEQEFEEDADLDLEDDEDEEG